MTSNDIDLLKNASLDELVLRGFTVGIMTGVGIGALLMAGAILVYLYITP